MDFQNDKELYRHRRQRNRVYKEMRKSKVFSEKRHENVKKPPKVTKRNWEQLERKGEI